MLRAKQPVLHRLNALRVCGEFLVMHAHYYSGIYADAHGYYPAGLWEGSDVMSFFFVLSGFVAMYSNMDNDELSTLSYIAIKVAKTYPLYLLVILINLISEAVHGSFNSQIICTWDRVCVLAEVLAVAGWCCKKINSVMGVGWYIATLYYMWLCFPVLRGYVKRYGSQYTWLKMALLWLLVTAGWSSLKLIDTLDWDLRWYPPLRLPEFVLGMMAALKIDRPTHLVVPLCSLAIILTYWALACAFFIHMPALWALEPNENECVNSLINLNMSLPVAHNNEAYTKMAAVQGKFSILWALIVHYAASSEINIYSTCFLDWDFFKSLSRFSLQLYMLHQLIKALCSTITRLIGFPDFFQIHTFILVAYTASYAFYTYVQPLLDRTATYLITPRPKPVKLQALLPDDSI